MLDIIQSLWYCIVLQGGDDVSKRRASGEGLLRWRKDRKHWEGRLVVGINEHGNPITKCFSGKSQKEVVDQMARYREQLRGMTLSADSRMKLREWTENWLKQYMVHRIRPTTLVAYQRKCEMYIYPYLGDYQISRITTFQIQRMYNDLREHGKYDRTGQSEEGVTGYMVRSIHMLLHEIMEYALKENMILSNPTNGTVIPKIEQVELQVLDEKQLKIFMNAIQKDQEWYDFFYLEIMTGLRRGEICALKWLDFDTVERKLYVNRSVSGQGVVGTTKTHYGVRDIKLPYSVYQLLIERKASASSEWIFPHPKDPTKAMPGDMALYRLRNILEEASLPHIRFHDLRHTFATHAVSAGIDPKTLSNILGHSKASFSLERYGHVTADMQKGAAKTMGHFFNELIGEEVKQWRITEDNPQNSKTEDGE